MLIDDITKLKTEIGNDCIFVNFSNMAKMS